MKKISILLLCMGLLVLTSCDRIQLIVENGVGSGSYTSEAKVSIKAHMPQPGYEFDKWEGDIQFVENIDNKETYIQLPVLDKDEKLAVKVKATYQADPNAKEYNLNVEEGSGTGSYLTYSIVTIVANPPQDGYEFDRWTGDVQYLNSPYLATQKVIIAREDISFKATYKEKIVPTIEPTIQPTVMPTVTPTVNPQDPQIIGSSFEDGFFVFEIFKGKLFSGAFGYAKKNKVFVYPPHQDAKPGFTTGESICAMMEFNGYLYANTENNGEIWRSGDGYNWQKVYKGGQHVGCGLAIHGDYLYAVNGHSENPSGYIYRTKDGTNWQTVYDSNGETELIREIVNYNGKLYAYVTTEKGSFFMLVSSDGTSWKKYSTPARMFRGTVVGDKLFVGSSTYYTSSSVTGIWKFDGNEFKLLHKVSNQTHVSNILGFKGAVVAITTKEWKGRGGGAQVLVSCNQGDSWKTLYTFKETESWAIKEYLGSLYVGTKQMGGGGKIYKFDSVGCGDIVDPTPTPTPTVEPTITPTPVANEKSCSQVEGFVWKLNKDGNTAVLITKKYQGCSIKTNGKSPNVPGGTMSDGRPYFRYSGHPSKFGSTAKVEIICNGKTEVTVNIPNTGERCSYYPGGWGD